MSDQPNHPDVGVPTEHEDADTSGDSLPDYAVVLDLHNADDSEPFQ